MNWKNIKLIFQREVRDQLRDRRTLFMVAVLPLLLYPALGIGMVQMTVTFSEQVRTVVLLGADQLPAPELIRDQRFAEEFFVHPEHASKLRVVTDLPGSLELLELSDAQRANLSTFIERVQSDQDAVQELIQIQEQFSTQPGQSLSNLEGENLAVLSRQELKLRAQLSQWFSTAPAQVVVIFPEGFREHYEVVNRKLAAREFAEIDLHAGPQPVILHNSADEKSDIAYQRVKQVLNEWKAKLLQQRLAESALPQTLPDAVKLATVDLAEANELAANVWSKIFPALLVIMSVTGAFYPAIDLGAGEKERGTMETLLISPATRTEIVLGKFFTVMLFSISTALLNLASMGFTGKHMLSTVGSAKASPIGDLSFPPLSSLTWVVLLAIPLAALFSALSLSFAMFAKSSKEGQYYLTPLLMVTMGLTMFCLNPAVELTQYHSVLPVVGPALLLKALLLGGASASAALMYVLPVLITSVGYSALALWWAIEQFQSEGILFREAEQFDLRLWIRHLLRDKEPTPSFMEAGVCFVMIALLQFIFLTSMQKNPTLLADPLNMVTVQLIYLIATVGVPPVLMAILLTSRPFLSLRLRWPSWQMLGAAIILPLSLQPLALELMSWLDPFFPPLPPGAEQMLRMMSVESVPLWLTFTTFAIAPAVCEELAFRGFLLSGLQRSRHKWLPIVISAVLFGAIHMIPKQQFNASLLGLVLGLLAVRSQSLLPCILFHAIFNGTQVLMARWGDSVYTSDIARRLFILKEGPEGMLVPEGFHPVFLGLCAGVSLALILWLLRTSESEPNEPALSGAERPLAAS